MSKTPLIAVMGMMFSAAAVSADSDDFYSAKVGADMWWGGTKVNEVRRDDSSSPSMYFAFEHKLPMLPNASIRYTTVDADYMAFDKYDYTFYYNVLEHDLLHFDAGVTFSQYSNTKYVDVADNNRTATFDELTWSFYGFGEINVPNTKVDIIGSMEFGDSSGIKSTDLMAGVQYRIPLESADIALRGGYRVIDLEAPDVFDSTLGKPFIFVDGWFAGAEVSF
ncbi:TIGR04219 family outer membrane beta-barrel protein [Vibrio sp. T187]|uniref:TIGR04219 family outer membrane beta-barrel protein n=1 Tax=Vibrio TaxID=662 RepID=UPI0010C9FB84|nr:MULTISPECIES: TIGR04219 family outer membrane beta-barrel protein [Vibrio]MBW3697504.1 TIGR04219 family outer membrane beta-barrel protein [Vibrio sp. T187]